jgi:hypothetical protein
MIPHLKPNLNICGQYLNFQRSDVETLTTICDVVDWTVDSSYNISWVTSSISPEYREV